MIKEALIKKLEEHLPHTDYSFDNKGCVLSFNTCDGFTRLENGVVNSVANRAVIFAAQKPHNSTSTTNAKARFATWKNRVPPKWFAEGLIKHLGGTIADG